MSGSSASTAASCTTTECSSLQTQRFPRRQTFEPYGVFASARSLVTHYFRRLDRRNRPAANSAKPDNMSAAERSESRRPRRQLQPSSPELPALPPVLDPPRPP